MIELLLSLILAVTGVARAVDPGLTSIAERRAAETATDATFSHTGMDPCCAEVLAWNLGVSDPARRAVEQWQGSPSHWAILTDASLTRIGCGVARGPDGRYEFACLLARGYDQPAAEPVVVTRSPKPTSAGSTPAGGATALPDTAMMSNEVVTCAPSVDRSKHLRRANLWTALDSPL